MAEGHSVADSFKAVIERDRVALPDTAPLSAFVDASRGITYGIVQPGQHDPSGIPILRVNNIRGGRILKHDVMRVTPEVEKKYQRTRLRGGEVLLTLVGTLGETAIVSDEQKGWNVARAVAVIPPAKGVSAKWLQICLGSAEVRHRIGSRATTTVQATLNLKDVAELPIYMPARATKDYIEKTISALDDKIELNRQMNETLEAMARALFKSWFVDFDPVRAKMEGRKPDGLSPDLAALFPDTMIDSPLGQIPKGWEPDLLVNICNVVYGKNLPTLNLTDSGYPVFGGNGEIGKYSRYLYDEPQVIIACRGAASGKVHRTKPKSFVTNNSLVCEILDSNKLNRFYLELALIEIDMTQFATGSAQPQITVQNLSNARVLMPNKSVMAAFGKMISSMYEKSYENDINSQSISSLRDLLLPKLISGDLRVRDTEGAIKEAV